LRLSATHHGANLNRISQINRIAVMTDNFARIGKAAL
jgi:hypothetical protein